MILFKIAVILFVRMWVEIYQWRYQKCKGRGHPLREDVSWNTNCNTLEELRKGHPLREDVSWNVEGGSYSFSITSSSSWGCELKCNVLLQYTWKNMSSSLWGCELKYITCSLCCFDYRHPPCEDVSWNSDAPSVLLYGRDVILLVRLWVEIYVRWTLYWDRKVILLVRMWVEINLQRFTTFSFTVILLVRLWVEIMKSLQLAEAKVVILFMRLWVEIAKEQFKDWKVAVILFLRMWVEMRWKIPEKSRKWSSSSWGCELKYLRP